MRTHFLLVRKSAFNRWKNDWWKPFVLKFDLTAVLVNIWTPKMRYEKVWWFTWWNQIIRQSSFQEYSRNCMWPILHGSNSLNCCTICYKAIPNCYISMILHDPELIESGAVCPPEDWRKNVTKPFSGSFFLTRYGPWSGNNEEWKLFIC